MNDDDLKLQEALRRASPATLPPGLREKVLGRAREARHRTRRRWTWRLSAAAALLVMLFVGNAIEQAEIEAGHALVASQAPSRAEQEAEQLTADLVAMLDGNDPARMQQWLRARLRVTPPEGGARIFQQWNGRQLDPLTQE